MAKKIKDTSLQNLPACAAEFIKLIVKKMRYRKKVRFNVQSELVAHFEDEIKGCTTDEEKEKRAEQLVAEFGDVKLLAVLMRRAKKRCRPLWRTVVARTFQTVGVLILCLILYVVWFLTGKPVITTNYVAELNRIACPEADESLNAAPLYHKAAKTYEELLIDTDTYMLLEKEQNKVTAEEKKRIEKWLSENEEIFELIIAGTQKPYYWPKYESDETNAMNAVLLPNLGEFKIIAHSLCWRAYLRAEQGLYEDAFNDLKSCYRFGRHLRGDKTLIEQFVGIAIESLAIQDIRNIISEHQIDSAALAALQRDLEQIIAGEDFVISLKAEKMFLYDELQRCFTEDRLGRGHLFFGRLKLIWPTIYMYSDPYELISRRGGTELLHILFTHPNKQQTREIVDHYFDFLNENKLKTPAQIRAENVDIEKKMKEIIKGNLLLEIITPELGRVIESGHRRRISVESTLTIVAILRYKKDAGNYPDSLEGLKAAGYLKELPMDPYSDKPLIYKKTGGNFILYGIGRNFTDDGGQIFYDDKGRLDWSETHKAGDWVFWPVPKTEK